MSVPNKNHKMKIRTFKVRDIIKIFIWRNDLVTIMNSLSGKNISLIEHLAWFIRKKLNAKNFHGFIISIKTQRIAFIFFEKLTEQSYEISINFDPKFRGKGLSKRALFLALDSITRIDNCEIIARIKHENEISKKLFQSCNFIYIKDLSTKDYGYYKNMETR